MSTVLNVIQTVVWGVVVLSVLVFVHEGGHYLVSRAFRVRATEFFLGLPCRFKLSRKSSSVGTEFGITPLLLGGYTKICGMEGEPDELLAPALKLVTERGRIRADELARELGIDVDRAYRLLITLTDWASVQPYYDAALGEEPNQKTYPAAFETVRRDANLLTEYDRGHDFSVPGATEAGQPREVALDGEKFLEQERAHTYQGVGFLKRCVILVAGPLVNVVLAFLIVTCALSVRGVDYVSNSNAIGGVEDASLAAEAGLEAGDVITSIGDTEVTTWEGIVDALEPLLEDGEPFELTYERESTSYTVEVDPSDDASSGKLGVYASVETYYPSVGEAASATLDYAGQVASYVAQLLQPNHTMEVLDQSSSVVGIAVMTSEAASSGAYDLALMVAAISMSLGFMNLLPIPPFDGGKILIELIQLVKRGPLSTRAVNVLNYVGMAFILFVFVVVLKNDIFRFVIG